MGNSLASESAEEKKAREDRDRIQHIRKFDNQRQEAEKRDALLLKSETDEAERLRKQYLSQIESGKKICKQNRDTKVHYDQDLMRRREKLEIKIIRQRRSIDSSTKPSAQANKLRQRSTVDSLVQKQSIDGRENNIDFTQRKLSKERRVKNAKEVLAENIDSLMRTSEKFSSTDPLSFRISLEELQRDNNVQVALAALNAEEEKNTSTLEQFVRSYERFKYYSQKRLVGLFHLTPYQGTLRVYGYFKCTCGNFWESAASWTDTTQQCTQCDAKIYPNRQLERDMETKAELAVLRDTHDRDRCGKCLTLRKFCLDSVISV